MSLVADLPELRGLLTQGSSIRIPGELNVPLTERIRRLIDTPAFQRLRRVSQLGLVAHVYPGATHSRFEHSLGAFRLALLYLARLSIDESFARKVTSSEALAFLAASLLHDIGHWPYCHPLEDMGLPEIEPHEQLAGRTLMEPGVRELLASDFQLQPDDLLRLLTGRPASPGERLLCSLLSSPIDVDKMDYLFRDSLHAGVPYGRHFDAQRIVDSLCVGRDGLSLAITEKGRTAAEMMVFARYIMFSEVYWHHAVRAATAMLQRAFFQLRARLNLLDLQQTGDAEFGRYLQEAAAGTSAASLVDGLFGGQRRLYKRWLEFDAREHPALFQMFARKPYVELCAASDQLATALSREIGLPLSPLGVLIDAPPPHLEIQFQLDIRHPRRQEFRTLAQRSPMVEALANRQFDDLVKRVRIFVAPELRSRVGAIPDPHLLIRRVVQLD